MKKAKAMVPLSSSICTNVIVFFLSFFRYEKGDDNGGMVFFCHSNVIVFFCPSFDAKKVTTTMSSSLCFFLPIIDFFSAHRHWFYSCSFQKENNSLLSF